MQRAVAMPKLGMTMTEGVLLRWHVAVGDVVAKDDVLAEVETDKVELEVEAPFSGTIGQLLATEGQTVPVGEPLVMIESEAAAKAPATMPSASPAPRPPSPGTSESATPAEAHESVTTSVQEPHLRIPSTPAARRVADELGVNLAAVAEASAHAGAPLRAADIRAFVALPTANRRTAVTPLARKIAEAHGIAPEKLAQQESASTAERIGRRVVEEALATRHTNGANGTNAANHQAHVADAPPTATTSNPAALALPVDTETDFTPLTSKRRIIAERTAHSFGSVPHIYLDIEVDMTEAEALRQMRAARAVTRQETAPTATAVFVHVVAAALSRHPEVNAGYMPMTADRPAGIQRWRDVNIGVAVALADGLIVPVIRHADRKSLSEIAQELNDLSRRAREGKLLPDDLSDATFSISNLGMFGIDTFHAVLNEPQAAILAIGRTQRRPTVISTESGGETIAIRPIVKLSLSADHRTLDGASGAQFLQTLRQFLEEPRLLL